MNKENFTTLIVVAGDITYVGKAARSSATDVAVWQIKRINEVDANTTDVEWADGVDNFNKIWDDRATYSYS